MLGPFDARPSSGQMLLALHSGKVPGYTPGGKNFIYVKDAAIGIANALTKGRIGESYIIGHENLSYKEAFSKMASVMNTRPPRIKFPRWAILAFGATNSVMSFFTRRNPGVTYALARIACDKHYYSAQKAVKELELPQTPIEEAIRDSFQWFKDNNYLQNAR